MKRIIPNKRKYLKITDKVFKNNEKHVVISWDKNNQRFVIKGLKEYFKSQGKRREKTNNPAGKSS